MKTGHLYEDLSAQGPKSSISGKYYSDRENGYFKGKRRRNSNTSMKSNKSYMKKRNMDFTNYAYREAVNRLKYLLAESYTTPDKSGYSKQDDSGDEQSENQSISTKGTDRRALSEISKYLSPSSKYSSRNTNTNALRKFKAYSPLSKENLSVPTYTTSADYLASPAVQTGIVESAHTPPEILNFIEKQENYIEQLEKESSFCRNELSNLLGKVKDVISENEALCEHARSDFFTPNKSSSSSESEETVIRKKDKSSSKSKLSGPNIVFESRISELEAELTQATIDLKRLRSENDELKRKIVHYGDGNPGNENALRKQVENLQKDKLNLEEQIRKLQNTVDDLRSETKNYASSKHQRNLTDIAIFEKSQTEIEVKHLRDELERQQERVRELQHEMARRVAEERANAERRYNFQVDQLGGDLSSQWEQVSRLQIDLERQKRVEADLKRDLAQRNAQIDDLKDELKTKRANFLSDIAQLNAEKQSLEQEAASLRLQLERSERQAKVENARLNAEINSLRQRLDRADADLLHAKRENLRLTDEMANLEKELTLGEMKNEMHPTTRDLNKTITEMQQKHEGTVHELEEMIQSQRQLMDKLTNECKALTNKLEESTLKHKTEISALQSNVEILKNKMINNDRDRIVKSDNYKNFSTIKAPNDYKPFSTSEGKVTSSISNPVRDDQPTSFAKDLSKYNYKPTSELTKSGNGIDSKDKQNLRRSYEYADDENIKDQFGEGDKLSGEEKYQSSYRGDKNDYNATGDTENQQQYIVQEQPTEYQGNYDEPGGYDQQQFGESTYETNYDQPYDQQQYQQYEDDQQYQRDQQYSGNQQSYLGDQQYSGYQTEQQQQQQQPYQPNYESSYDQALKSESRFYGQQQPLPISVAESTVSQQSSISATSNVPTPATTTSNIPATSTIERESRFQPKTSNGVMGSTGTRRSEIAAGEKESSNVLSKQPSETVKGLSTPAVTRT